MKKSISVVLVMLFILTGIVVAFTGCGNEDVTPTNSVTDNQNTYSDVETPNTVDIPKGENISKSNSFEAKKVGAIFDRSRLNFNSQAIIYEAESGKHGIMSVDGKKDTGAVYGYCEYNDNYVIAIKDLIADPDDINSINSYGLVDYSGKTLVPFKYAAINELSERYVQVFTATDRVSSKDDAAIFLETSLFKNQVPDNEDLMYSASWEIFDLETGNIVNGVKESNLYRVEVSGNLIKYVTNEAYRIVNEKGEEITDEVSFIGDDWYTIKKDSTYEIYSPEGKLAFSYTNEQYSSIVRRGEYFLVSATEGNMLLDETGKAISKVFDSSIYGVYGSFVSTSDDKLSTFDGKVIYEGNIGVVEFDEITGKYLMIKSYNNNETTLIDLEGNIIHSAKNAQDLTVSSTDFSFSKKTDSFAYKFYSIEDNDYVLEGNSAGRWLIYTEGDESTGNRDLVETITGDIVISGYLSYIVRTGADGIIRVYAENDNGFDIYELESKVA